jgi:hypothetical protein
MSAAAVQRSRHPDLCFCPDCLRARPSRRAQKKTTLARARALVEGADGKRAACKKCGAARALADGICGKCKGP